MSDKRVVASDGEPMQDHDRNGPVDKRGESRGVFASKQRPGAPRRSVGQNEPVGGRGDAVELLGANRPHDLRQADYTGETGSEPSEQLRNHRVTSSALASDAMSLVFRRPSQGLPSCGPGGTRQGFREFGKSVRPDDGLGRALMSSRGSRPTPNARWPRVRDSAVAQFLQVLNSV
jgi:hypothetical protein